MRYRSDMQLKTVGHRYLKWLKEKQQDDIDFIFVTLKYMDTEIVDEK